MKKLINILIIFSMLLNPIFGLSIVETTNPDALQEAQGQSIWSDVPWGITIGMGLAGVVIALVLYIIFRIVLWVYKKLTQERKPVDDNEYYKYNLDLKMVRLNANKHFKYRRWWSWFLLWKKAPVYAQTEFGRKFLGYYDGECVKKEDYFLFGLELRHSFFNREIDVVIIPYNLRKYMVKYNDDFSIDLVCEGIDEVMSSEYYSIPVIKNQGDDKNKIFVDFSNNIMEKFYKEYIYRDIIKSTLSDSKEAVKDAVEMNPSIQYSRKTGGDLTGK